MVARNQFWQESRIPIQMSKWATSADLHSLDDTTFGHWDDYSAHSYTSLLTKFPEFTLVVSYNSITVFNTCSYLFIMKNIILHHSPFSIFLFHHTMLPFTKQCITIHSQFTFKISVVVLSVLSFQIAL